VIPVKKDGKDKALAVGTANPFTGRTNGGCEVWLDGFDGESGWAAGTRYVAKGNWATYTPYAGSAKTVPLYAGQTIVAGDVSFSTPVNGKVTITITLKPGWFFNNVSDNVKIQDYTPTPPLRNPSPGQFAWKGYAYKCSFSMEVPANK
jgi:hypothetical protein